MTKKIITATLRRISELFYTTFVYTTVLLIILVVFSKITSSESLSFLHFAKEKLSFSIQFSIFLSLIGMFEHHKKLKDFTTICVFGKKSTFAFWYYGDSQDQFFSLIFVRTYWNEYKNEFGIGFGIPYICSFGIIFKNIS